MGKIFSINLEYIFILTNFSSCHIILNINFIYNSVIKLLIKFYTLFIKSTNKGAHW